MAVVILGASDDLSGGSGGSSGPGNPPLDLVGYESRLAQYPTFVKYASNPILKGLGVSGSPLTASVWNPVSSNSQQWPITRPWVLRVDELVASPLGKFYMWFSTDHATDHGGIGLAYANDPLGPWTYYGQVYQDATTNSTQTEWPSVVWDEDNACFNLYHHVVGLPGVVGGQVTCLATSADGKSSWTRVGPVIDVGLHNGSNGNDYWSGGSSYPSVFRLADKWFAYLFLATGTYSRGGLAVSNDGRSWHIDPRYLGDQTTLIGNPTQRHFLPLNHLPFWWQGRQWIVTLDASWVSGHTANPCDFFAAPATDNLRLFRAKPKQCVASTLQGWETTFFKIGSVLAYHGSLYLYYRSGLPIADGGAGESFGVAVATPGAV